MTNRGLPEKFELRRGVRLGRRGTERLEPQRTCLPQAGTESTEKRRFLSAKAGRQAEEREFEERRHSCRRDRRAGKQASGGAGAPPAEKPARTSLRLFPRRYLPRNAGRERRKR